MNLDELAKLLKDDGVTQASVEVFSNRGGVRVIKRIEISYQGDDYHWTTSVRPIA